MRRWILIALLMVLPFQAVWAVAAPYCAHEQDIVATHVGHHEHQHRANVDGDSLPASAQGDADCAICHLGSAATLPSALQVSPPPVVAQRLDYREPLYVSLPPSGPERPDRHGCPAPARCGGGAPGPYRMT